MQIIVDRRGVSHRRCVRRTRQPIKVVVDVSRDVAQTIDSTRHLTHGCNICDRWLSDRRELRFHKRRAHKVAYVIHLLFACVCVRGLCLFSWYSSVRLLLFVQRGFVGFMLN